MAAADRFRDKSRYSDRQQIVRQQQQQQLWRMEVAAVAAVAEALLPACYNIQFHPITRSGRKEFHKIYQVVAPIHYKFLVMAQSPKNWLTDRFNQSTFWESLLKRSGASSLPPRQAPIQIHGIFLPLQSHLCPRQNLMVWSLPGAMGCARAKPARSDRKVSLIEAFLII